MRAVSVVIAVVVFGFVVLATVFFNPFDERTWVAIQNPNGTLAGNGPTFGVAIGDLRVLAARELQARGFTYSETARSGTCLSMEASEMGEVEVYYDFGWRRGTLCVVVEADKVVDAEWAFVPFAP